MAKFSRLVNCNDLQLFALLYGWYLFGSTHLCFCLPGTRTLKHPVSGQSNKRWCNWLLVEARFQCRLWACSHGSEGPRQGEVPHLPVVKKYLSSHATLGTRGEVQKAITWLLRTHKTKNLSFIPMRLLFASMYLLEAKLSSDSANKLAYLIPRLNCRSTVNFISVLRWNRRNKSPPSSDSITPVRRVIPLRSFHMEKTHPNESGYPYRLTG